MNTRSLSTGLILGALTPTLIPIAAGGHTYFELENGEPADATKLMSNFDHLRDRLIAVEATLVGLDASGLQEPLDLGELLDRVDDLEAFQANVLSPTGPIALNAGAIGLLQQFEGAMTGPGNPVDGNTAAIADLAQSIPQTIASALQPIDQELEAHAGHLDDLEDALTPSLRLLGQDLAVEQLDLAATSEGLSLADPRLYVLERASLQLRGDQPGTGNLIVSADDWTTEPRAGEFRTGVSNVVLGAASSPVPDSGGNQFTGRHGIVAGRDNLIGFPLDDSPVSFDINLLATLASELESGSVLGGLSNRNHYKWSVIVGGLRNVMRIEGAEIDFADTAAASLASAHFGPDFGVIVGGQNNTLEDGQPLEGVSTTCSTILGGAANRNSASTSVIGGGQGHSLNGPITTHAFHVGGTHGQGVSGNHLRINH